MALRSSHIPIASTEARFDWHSSDRSNVSKQCGLRWLTNTSGLVRKLWFQWCMAALFFCAGVNHYRPTELLAQSHQPFYADRMQRAGSCEGKPLFIEAEKGWAQRLQADARSIAR